MKLVSRTVGSHPRIASINTKQTKNTFSVLGEESEAKSSVKTAKVEDRVTGLYRSWMPRVAELQEEKGKVRKKQVMMALEAYYALRGESSLKELCPLFDRYQPPCNKPSFSEMKECAKQKVEAKWVKWGIKTKAKVEVKAVEKVKSESTVPVVANQTTDDGFTLVDSKAKKTSTKWVRDHDEIEDGVIFAQRKQACMNVSVVGNKGTHCLNFTPLKTDKATWTSPNGEKIKCYVPHGGKKLYVTEEQLAKVKGAEFVRQRESGLLVNLGWCFDGEYVDKETRKSHRKKMCKLLEVRQSQKKPKTKKAQFVPKKSFGLAAKIAGKKVPEEKPQVQVADPTPVEVVPGKKVTKGKKKVKKEPKKVQQVAQEKVSEDKVFQVTFAVGGNVLKDIKLSKDLAGKVLAILADEERRQILE